MDKLLLAEHAYQVQDFINRGLKDKGVWIALGPSAMGCLDGLGIPYQIPEDFYPTKELSAACEKTRGPVESLCDSLDQHLLERHPELKQWGMRPFLFNIFPLMILIDGLRSRILQLSRIFQAYPQHSVIIHKGKRFARALFDLCFSNKETLWGHIASLSGWDVPIEVLTDPDCRGRWRLSVKGAFFSGLKSEIFRSVGLTTIMRNLKARDYRGALDVLRWTRGSVLVVNAPYEWAAILPALRKLGIRVLFANDEFFRGRDVVGSRETFPLPMSEAVAAWTDCFQVGNVCFYPLLQDRLSWIWENAPQQYGAVTRAVAEIKRKYNLRVILRSSAGMGINHAMNQAAQNMGLTVCVWQHGFVGYSDRITQFRDYCDRMTANVVLVYGGEVAKAYSSYGRKFDSTVIPAGAATLDTLQSRRKSSAKARHDSRLRVLYATTDYQQNNWYMGMTPGFSDRLLFRDQLAIANFLKEAVGLGRVEAIVKLHPSRFSMDPPWLLHVNGVRGLRLVKDEQSFESLLSASDCVLLDCPSTTLLQALAGGVPVFVLMRHWQYPPEARALLRRRAIPSDCVEDLLSGVSEYLKSGIYPSDLADTSFLQAYGTYLDDGKSGERAVSVVTRILGNTPQKEAPLCPH